MGDRARANMIRASEHKQELQVETYSSFAYAVEPRAYILDRVRHTVAAIVRTWRTPDGLHFYVRDERDEFAELIYDEHRGVWTVREFGTTCAREI